MDIHKLKEGMTIKNYKELCALLGIEVASGNTKISQLRDIERYFSYEKLGNKFIIKEIYAEPKEKIEKNKLTYTKYIEKLILDLLAQSKNDEVYLSKNQMFKALKMVNENYSYCKVRPLKLSNFINIHEDIINEWYDSTDGLLVRNLENSLNNLRKQALIIWSSEMAVCKLETNNNNIQIREYKKIDEFQEELIEYRVNASQSHRPATKEEKKKILEIERETMLHLGFDNKQEVILNGKWSVFKEVVKEEVINNLHIAFYYNCYKVIFNPNHIQDALIKLEAIERKNTQNILNKEIVKRVNDNSTKRHYKAVEECIEMYGEVKNNKMNNRLNKNYINDCNSLSKHLIDIESEDIRDDIRTTIVD